MSCQTLCHNVCLVARHEVDKQGRDLALEKRAIPAMEEWPGLLGAVMLASLGRRSIQADQAARR